MQQTDNLLTVLTLFLLLSVSGNTIAKNPVISEELDIKLDQFDKIFEHSSEQNHEIRKKNYKHQPTEEENSMVLKKSPLDDDLEKLQELQNSLTNQITQMKDLLGDIKKNNKIDENLYKFTKLSLINNLEKGHAIYSIKMKINQVPLKNLDHVLHLSDSKNIVLYKGLIPKDKPTISLEIELINENKNLKLLTKQVLLNDVQLSKNEIAFELVTGSGDQSSIKLP